MSFMRKFAAFFGIKFVAEKVQDQQHKQSPQVALPLQQDRQPIPFGFAEPSRVRLVDTRSRRHSFAFGGAMVDCRLMSDQYAVQRAALTLATAKRNHGQWNRWHG